MIAGHERQDHAHSGRGRQPDAFDPLIGIDRENRVTSHSLDRLAIFARATYEKYVDDPPGLSI